MEFHYALYIQSGWFLRRDKLCLLHKRNIHFASNVNYNGLWFDFVCRKHLGLPSGVNKSLAQRWPACLREDTSSREAKGGRKGGAVGKEVERGCRREWGTEGGSGMKGRNRKGMQDTFGSVFSRSVRRRITCMSNLDNAPSWIHIPPPPWT